MPPMQQEKAMEMLVELNKLAFEFAEADRDAGRDNYRFRMGAYFHKEIQAEDSTRGAVDKEPVEK